MSKQIIPFTPEQKIALEANPFTLHVTDYKIWFTIEFKQYMIEERTKNHTKWKDVFRKAGYDPDVLGKARIDYITKSVLKEAASPEGLRETISRKPVRKSTDHQQLRVAIRDLQSEVTRLNQQIEFLKKTQLIRQLDKKEDQNSMH